MSKTINIVGLNESKSYKSKKGTKVEFFHIELNNYPDEEWIKLFESYRSRLKHSQTIPFNIKGKYIVIECTKEMLDSKYLKELETNIQNIGK